MYSPAHPPAVPAPCLAMLSTPPPPPYVDSVLVRSLVKLLFCNELRLLIKEMS